MAHSAQHQNSQQSAQTFPWPLSNLSPNQPDLYSQLQVQSLRLAHARKQIQEYEDLIASLYTALHNIENKICVTCRAHLEKYAPACLATAASRPKFSLSRPSKSPRSSAPSNRMPLWHRLFKGHHTISLHLPGRPNDLESSDVTGRSGVSRLSNAKASDFIQHNRSVSVSSESIQPSSSLSVSQRPISLPETSTSLKHIPNQLDWSVDFNSDVKPELNVKLEHVLTFGDVVWCVRFSPDGKYLGVGVGNGRTYICDVKTGTKSCFLADNYETRKGGIWSLCFSPDSKYLAVGGYSGKLRIWEIAKKRTRNICRQHTNTITGLDFSPDGCFLVSCSYDRVVLWRMRDGFSKVLEDNSGFSFCCVKFNLDGQYIAAGHSGGIMMIWNVQTSQPVEKWTAHENTYSIWSVAFTLLDGNGSVSSSRAGTWNWDMSLLEPAEPGYGMTRDGTVRQKSKVAMHTNDVNSFAVSPDSRSVVSGSSDHAVRIWDLRNAVLQCTLKGHRDRVWSVDFCPTGNCLASGSGDGRAALWRYAAA